MLIGFGIFTKAINAQKLFIMKTAIIIGATGLVGSSLTQLLLEDSRYEKIKILVRKKINLEHSKLEQLIFNFDNPDNSIIKGDELYCCLGTTIKKAGSQNAFRKVDFDYPTQIAKIAKHNNIQKMAVVSSMGANSKSKIFYNKVKGEMEETLKNISFQSLIIVRPSLLLGKREEFRFGEKVASFIMTIFSIFIPAKYKGIKAHKVASGMIYFMNQENNGIKTIESGVLWRL